MIKYIKGDLFASPAQVLVNTVNLDGVMGKGIALTFKKLYPSMFFQYQKYCESKQLDIGKLWIYKAPNKWILNFPTKRHWRHKSKMEYIELGLKKFVDTYQQKGITSIAFPMLGCGNGGLDWNDVKPLMDNYLKNLPIDVYVYESNFGQKQEFKNIQEIKAWLDSYPHDLSAQEFIHDVLEKLPEGQLVDMDSAEFTQELVNFWNAVKADPYLTKDRVPRNLHEVFDATAKLPYIYTVQINRGLSNSPEIAIQLKNDSREIANV